MFQIAQMIAGAAEDFISVREAINDGQPFDEEKIVHLNWLIENAIGKLELDTELWRSVLIHSFFQDWEDQIRQITGIRGPDDVEVDDDNEDDDPRPPLRVV